MIESTSIDFKNNFGKTRFRISTPGKKFIAASLIKTLPFYIIDEFVKKSKNEENVMNFVLNLFQYWFSMTKNQIITRP
jgi:hypothetical protein